MPRRLTNDLLLTLILAQVLSGLLGWALPVARVQLVYDAHRVLGVALILLLVWKQAIVLPSLARRLRRRPWDRSVVWGSVAAVALVAALGLGLAWTLNIITFDLLWGYSPMTVHVALGIGVLPFVAVHALARRRQNRASAPVRSRRALVRVGGLTLAGIIGWQLVERVSGLTLRAGDRLQTGSKHVVSFSGNAYPAQIWLFDAVPSIDRDAWRLHMAGQLDRPGAVTYADLAADYPVRHVQAVLDCTSGWWTEQVWTGVAVLDVLRRAGVRASASSVTVSSTTGHQCSFPIQDLDGALLATHVGNEELSSGHGYPVRLAIPGRRGYQWVKWVDRIEVS